MLFSCSPPASHGAPLRARGRQRGAQKQFTIDIHCHVETPEAAALVKDALDPMDDPLFRFASPETREEGRKQHVRILPQLTSVERRLKDMDKAGIDMQVI